MYFSECFEIERLMKKGGFIIKDYLLRTVWILPNILMYFTSLGLVIFVSVFYRDLNNPFLFVYLGFVVLTMLFAVFGTYKIILWIREGKM
ncbi:hypothetical protein EEX84_10830 [Planococcus salinus]|uniref:Uncharacterized protein n=1 Tax=Planococcus salinus TaxID=1848460 RepID=A0A3M8P665_9BACL|nr:hypothetical protein EEX84_10830 [Planococcus salinus]